MLYCFLKLIFFIFFVLNIFVLKKKSGELFMIVVLCMYVLFFGNDYNGLLFVNLWYLKYE